VPRRQSPLTQARSTHEVTSHSGSTPALLLIAQRKSDKDPFLPGDEAFVAGLKAAGATLTHKTWAGEHTEEDWDSRWRSYLGFYADALSTRES
jgi:hypothetical protein